VKVLFLGTGTSHGVPMIGCACAVCRSEDPRDSRTRPSVLVTLDTGERILIDTATDLRSQALRYGIDRVDAILFTHSHADHIFGLDDTRRFNAGSRESLPLFADAATVADLRRVFAYAFSPKPLRGGGVPALTLFPIAGPFSLFRQAIVPVPLVHGCRPILGFRVGRFAYLTDCNAIPESSWSMLRGLDVLVLDALRDRPHPTHFTVREAVDAARIIGARRTLLTHLCHEVGHAELLARLPDAIEPAYDGLALEIDSSGDPGADAA
jgi:phosphoribosyl 1,2-cyclic phosphate phosphodiesterase